MSTAAVIRFTDANETVSIYQHWDGYPAGVIAALKKAFPLARSLDDFEAGEFAAAYVAANKAGPGNIYLMGAGTGADVDYTHDVALAADGAALTLTSTNDEDGAVTTTTVAP